MRDRCPLYIPSSISLVLYRLELDFPNFSDVVDVVGRCDLEVIDGIFCGRFIIGDNFLGASSASMFEPSALLFESLNMLMLPTVMPISEPTTFLLKFDGSLIGIPVLLSLQGGYDGCTSSFFVSFFFPPRSFPMEVTVMGSMFLDPLCGIVACWSELTGDATGIRLR